MISFTLVNICKIINKFKKLPSISLDTWFFLPCVCRRKHFTLPLTRFYFSVPLISNLSFCPVSLKPSSLPLPVEIFFYHGMFILLFNSHEWPRQNFSSPNQYNIKHTSDENKKKYPFDYQLIHYQIHRKILLQTVRRITHVILGVKGSIQWCRCHHCLQHYTHLFLIKCMLVKQVSQRW